jgi:hypothetical protein
MRVGSWIEATNIHETSSFVDLNCEITEVGSECRKREALAVYFTSIQAKV